MKLLVFGNTVDEGTICELANVWFGGGIDKITVNHCDLQKLYLQKLYWQKLIPP